MAKIFVSYKYSDQKVAPLDFVFTQGEVTECRHYVTFLESLITYNDHIYKGERDNESLADFKDETIESKLRPKIFDSTVTIVLVSKGMKDLTLTENDQWIPWEISYSLKEMTKDGRTSGTNAMLAVILPDETNSYSYMVNHYNCFTGWNTNSLFKILEENMFNRSDKRLFTCTTCGGTHHTNDDHSYIHPVKWENFIKNINYYLEIALRMKNNINDFNIRKVV